MQIPSLKITDRCVSCDNCNLICPEDAILSDGRIYKIERNVCTLCGFCIQVCPADCIKIDNEP